jgi:hypothetical protein
MDKKASQHRDTKQQAAVDQLETPWESRASDAQLENIAMTSKALEFDTWGEQLSLNKDYAPTFHPSSS